MQHPEVEAGQPSLRPGLRWSQGACCRAGGIVCVERGPVLAVVEHTGQGVHSCCEMGRESPLGRIGGHGCQGAPAEKAARGLGALLHSPEHWRLLLHQWDGVGRSSVWPAYRGLAGI